MAFRDLPLRIRFTILEDTPTPSPDSGIPGWRNCNCGEGRCDLDDGVGEVVVVAAVVVVVVDSAAGMIGREVGPVVNGFEEVVGVDFGNGVFVRVPLAAAPAALCRWADM